MRARTILFPQKHSILVYFWTCGCCPQGWGSFYAVVQSTLQCKQHKKNHFFTKALSPCLFLVLWLLTQGWGHTYFMVQSTLQCKQHKVENSFFKDTLSLSILRFCGFCPRDGDPSMLWCEAPFNASNESQKVLFFPQKHPLLVFFWSCGNHPKGWRPHYAAV